MMQNIFDQKLFWDIKNPDLIKNKNTIIFKVLRYGDLKDFLNLKKVYSKDDIYEFLKKKGSQIDHGEKKLLDVLYNFGG